MVKIVDTDPVLAELREQTKWLRLLGLQALRPILKDALQTDKQRLIYEYSNGDRTTREVGKLAGVSISVVSRLWTQWIAAGICVESPKMAGRAQHLITLSQVGMDIPATPAHTTSAEDDESEG